METFRDDTPYTPGVAPKGRDYGIVYYGPDDEGIAQTIGTTRGRVNDPLPYEPAWSSREITLNGWPARFEPCVSYHRIVVPGATRANDLILYLLPGVGCGTIVGAVGFLP